MAKAPTKTNREKMQALQEAMEADQKEAAKELLELVTSDGVKELLEKANALTERSIPGQVLEQSIQNLNAVMVNIPPALEMITGPAVIEEGTAAGTPAP